MQFPPLSCTRALPRALTRLLLGLAFGHPLVAQPATPVLRTNTRAITIRDGGGVVDWWLEPDVTPDVYRVAFPRRTNTVTYVTDVDSITFTIRPGESRDLIVLLNGSTMCLNQLSSVAAFARPRVIRGDSLSTQIIPFTVRSNRIYVRGQINGSAPLLLQLDLGASGSAINRSSHGEGQMTFDATDILLNSDGRKPARASSKNQLSIGALQWDAERFVETGNMSSWEDGLIGNGLFRDFVVEIDYNRHELRLHRSLPSIPPTAQRFDMVLDGVRPLIQATLTTGDQAFEDWYLFDTGHTGGLLLSAKQNRAHNLRARLGAWMGLGARKIVRVHDFRIGTFAMPSTIAVLETHSTGDSGHKYGVLGNSWLRQFNTIIDNQAGHLYLSRAVAPRR